MTNEEHVCDLVTREEIDYFSMLTFSFSEGWDIDEFLLSKLEKYGSSFITVYDNMNLHFKECDECRTCYGKQLVMHRKVALKTEVFDTDDMEEIRDKVHEMTTMDKQMKRYLRNVLNNDDEGNDEDL